LGSLKQISANQHPKSQDICNVNKNGMSRLLKSCTFIAPVYFLVAVVILFFETTGKCAYLSVVGSPPLRFQVPSTNHLDFKLESFAQIPKPPETSNATAEATEPMANTNAEENLAETSNAPSVLAANPPAPKISPEILPAKTNENVVVENDSQNNTDASPISSSSDADLPTVTPQMIAEYLRPPPNERTGATNNIMFVPVEMQFPPPTRIEGQSRATYRVQ
jgi:hypothetical protein